MHFVVALCYFGCCFLMAGVECADLVEIRKKYFEERSWHSLFRNVILEIIFDFLREIGVFYEKRSVLRSCLCEVF